MNVEGTDMFKVTVTEHEVAEVSGKDCCVVHFTVENISSEDQRAPHWLQRGFYQGDPANVLDCMSVDGTTRTMADIGDSGTLKPGESGELVAVVKLGDDRSTPITLEVFGYSDATDHVTFELPIAE